MYAGHSGWSRVLGSFSLMVFGALLATPANAAPIQTPDVIVYDVGVDGANTSDIHYWGQAGDIAAYSIATQSCNAGTAELDWITSGGSTLHPVIGQNMFRHKNGRFEHVGQSWLKHGFCAVNEVEALCAPCQSTPCDTLGIGCADTYWATLNDGQDGQSKRNINAANGSHVHGGGPSGNATIRGRLQVVVSDMEPAQNTGANYFIEGHYVTADDAVAGASGNNASWRHVNVNSVSNITGGGSTMREEPAIFAWRSYESGVEIKSVPNLENAGTKTTFYLAFKVTDLGHGKWHYEYALQNLNSDQSAGSYSVPVMPGVLVTNIGFHDVFYHSGDPYDGTDWPGVKQAGEVRWATVPFATNANANALRWGTLYNFRFDANAPPIRASVNVGLFKPAVNTDIVVDDVLVPGGNDPGGHVLADGRPVPAPLSVPRNGSQTNPFGLVESSAAVIGRDWSAEIRLEGVSRSLLFVSLHGPAEGTFNKLGEVLIQPPVLSRTNADLRLPIPNDARLIGLQFSTQAAVRTKDGWRLTNALDVTIGGAH